MHLNNIIIWEKRGYFCKKRLHGISFANGREGKARPACEVHIVTSDGARKHAGIHLDRPFCVFFFIFIFLVCSNLQVLYGVLASHVLVPGRFDKIPSPRL
jgi:hypothetical protein